MKSIVERFEGVEAATRRLSDLMDAAYGTEWRTRHLPVQSDEAEYQFVAELIQHD